MGKINAHKDIEVIPLEPPSSMNSPFAGAAGDHGGGRTSKGAYFADPTIITRVHKYLEENLNNRYVDINVMAEELQKKYGKDYGKRKRSAFRALVKKAYSIVMQNYGIKNTEESSSEELSDESVEDISMGNDSALRNQLLEMYGRNMAPKPVVDNELIDISSDDSDSEKPSKKPTNGPSTSQKQFDHQSITLTSIPTSKHLSDSLRIEKLPPRPPSRLPFNAYERGKKRKNDLAELIPQMKRKRVVTPVANMEEPTATFKDIGGLDNVLIEVCKLLVHIKHPEVYKQIGVTPPRGFLLHGPPGCGKTLLAHAIAGELTIPLLKVSAPELVAGVSGESEERIRELFERAVAVSPCVLFIDEIDAITQNRQFAQKDMEKRIVAQLLTCLDDLNKNVCAEQVLVIGATNRPDSLDPALRRAGRFDREISLGIPDAASRLQILKVLTKDLKLEENFDFESLAKLSPGFVGADLMSLVREAAMAAVTRVFNAMKEKLKLEQAVAAQKVLEEKEKEPIVEEVVVTPDVVPAPVEEEEKEKKKKDDEPEKPEAEEESNKDAEIIVDGDENSKPETSTDAIVVIDDEINNKAEKAEKVKAPNVRAFIQKELKNMTPLQEIMTWLHTELPLNEEELGKIYVTTEDFAHALKVVQPSAKREGFATVPDVTWDDVGSLRDIREELQMAILAPVRHSEQFSALGLNTPTGVLLCGPPGCGKTLLAKAVANEAGINFISVKGPELLNMYVGESERAVRLCFERARNSAPCVIFFDELDALCPKRSDAREGGASMRVVNQMLTEMDGVQSRAGVYLLAASNRPDIIDPAVLRPGRLDKILYVGLPTPEDRVDILRTITKNGTRPLMALDVDLEAIGKSEQCEGYTGADLAALVREAGIYALREIMIAGDLQKAALVKMEHFTKAVEKIRPSVTDKDKAHYAKLKKIYSAKQPEVEEMEVADIQTH